MPSPRIRVVTRADDIGSFHSANRAALDACKNGLVRNVSMLAVGGAFDEAAEMFATERDICIGLHACITCEWATHRWKPLLPARRVPCIVEPDGTMKRNADAIHEGGTRLDQIMAELEAQLAHARSRNLDIRYIDDHMSIPWLFEGSERNRLLNRMVEWADQEELVWAGWGNALGLERLECDTVETDTVEALSAAVRAAPPDNYLLVGHPAYDDDEMRAVTHAGQAAGRVARERDMQRRMFMDSVVVEAFEQAGAAPIRFDEL